MKADTNRIRKYLGDVNAAPSASSSQSRSNLDCTNIERVDELETDCDTELADILNEYLEQLENGNPADIDQLLARYPQYEQPLREYLDGLSLLNAGIAEMSDSPFRFDDDQQTLGDYDLIREIGRGGMGVVYEARQISLDRRVALKVLPFAAMLDQRQIVRFETEARAAARLQHPHIVPVYGVGCDRGVHYYAMQFIDGSSIRELIDSDRDLDRDLNRDFNQDLNRELVVTPREAARLGAQAASALHTAHTCGIVHRDIKPSNLLLDASRDVWIADFGLARNASDNNVTRSGDVLGTLHYMSPEQARGNSSIADPRSDIYSLGVTLYELLSQQRPFTGDSTAAVLEQIEQGFVTPLRLLNSDVPRDLENVITKAMSLEPEHRYQTAAEFEADLNRFMDGRATLAKPLSALQKLSRWSSRNRSLVASFVAVLMVACVAFACSTFWLAEERAELAALNQTAERKLETTEATFEQFGLGMAERLKQIPGSASARKALLADLLTHYEDLLDVSENNPSMLEDRAITCTKIANIHRESGDLQQAIVAYEEAAANFQTLVAGSHNATDIERSTTQLAKCQSNMSVVLLELGEISKAATKLNNAMELQTRLLSAHPTANRMMDLAASHTNLASIELAQGNPGQAPLDRAKTLAEEARQKCSQDELPKVLTSLSTIYGRLSSLLRSTQTSDAISYAEKAVACSQDLLTTSHEVEQNEFRQLHALNCNNLASLFVEAKNSTAAIPLYQAASTQLDQIDAQEQLALTLCNLAKAESHAGNSLGAVNTYAKAITVQSSLLLNSPGNLNHVSRLGGMHNNRAFALQKIGKHDRANMAYESAIEFQERAYQLAPKDIVYYRDALSRTLFNASQTAMKAGRPTLAADLQLRRARLWPTDAQQLFSVARNIAAATQQMPTAAANREAWTKKAQALLELAVVHDKQNLLDEAKVSQLSRYVSQEGA